MHNEYDALNVYPMIQNRNAYPRGYNSFGDDSSMFIKYDGNLCETTIVDNTDLISNNIP